MDRDDPVKGRGLDFTRWTYGGFFPALLLYDSLRSSASRLTYLLHGTGTDGSAHRVFIPLVSEGAFWQLLFLALQHSCTRFDSVTHAVLLKTTDKMISRHLRYSVTYLLTSIIIKI